MLRRLGLRARRGRRLQLRLKGAPVAAEDGLARLLALGGVLLPRGSDALSATWPRARYRCRVDAARCRVGRVARALLFAQLTQPHSPGRQYSPAAKQSQYILMHFEFLHVQRGRFCPAFERSRDLARLGAGAFPAGGSNGPGGASLSEPAGCAAGRRGARVEVVAPSKPSGIGESPKSACGVW